MKTAIVYDRVNKWGGAERVLLTLHEMFPKAPLYTSVYNEKTAPWASVFPKVYTSFLQKLPFFRSRHELLAPLMPLAFESLNFDEYDLVISVTSESAKGIITKPQTKHICYMLTPTRYLWSGYNDYFKRQSFKGVTKPIVEHLRQWDKVAAQRPDVVVGISSEVQKRIKKYYGRESEIVFPPVEIQKFKTKNSNVKTKTKSLKTKDYYLVVSRLVGYKKVDLAIKVFNQLEKKLVIVGTGHEKSSLKKRARSNIIFTGHLTDKELLNYYINAKALVFPQVEDFGLVAVEAQAAGTPVIAFRAGGALDTVIDGKTGIFFSKQSETSLIDAVKRFEKKTFVKSNIIKNAEKFSSKRFSGIFM